RCASDINSMVAGASVFLGRFGAYLTRKGNHHVGHAPTTESTIARWFWMNATSCLTERRQFPECIDSRHPSGLYLVYRHFRVVHGELCVANSVVSSPAHLAAVQS